MTKFVEGQEVEVKVYVNDGFGPAKWRKAKITSVSGEKYQHTNPSTYRAKFPVRPPRRVRCGAYQGGCG